jgi:hypothetical protein
MARRARHVCFVAKLFDISSRLLEMKETRRQHLCETISLTSLPPEHSVNLVAPLDPPLHDLPLAAEPGAFVFWLEIFRLTT